jgi:sugar lactone lactonase YvrE
VDNYGNLFIADKDNNRIRKVNNTQGLALALNNVTAANAGNYQVIVTGFGGSVTSSVATLTVGTITSQPVSLANLPGTTATFSVAVGGIPSLSYQWLKNGVTLTNGGNVTGSTGTTLTLSNVQDADAASYTVVVSNNMAGSVTSSPACLMVIDGIKAQPANQTVWAGGNVILAAVKAGAGPFTYQWQLNSTNLPDGIIMTVAGNGTNGYSGDGGAATNASLHYPSGVEVDAAGNLFIADNGNNRIREVSTNGIITTVAGNGTNSYSGDGGAATNAEINQALGVALDNFGNLFIADYHNHRIREVSANGIIMTVVGNGTNRFSGDSGAATNASLNLPAGIALDGSGNLFIADLGNNRIREVNTNGIIMTVAGGTYGYSGDGGAATNASLNSPSGIAVDATGNLFIADYGNNRIREVSTNGIITPVVALMGLILRNPTGVAVDNYGNLFIADFNNCRILEVSASGITTTVAGTTNAGFSGDGGAATNASLCFPSSVAVDNHGNLFIADESNNRIRKVNSTHEPSLALNNVNPAKAGSYQVVVTGPAGSVTSSVANLVVLLPPQGFTGQANNAGGSPQISLQFTGTPNYPYILQMTTNLTPPIAWQSILTNPADGNGKWSWTLTNPPAFPAGFYRAASQ